MSRHHSLQSPISAFEQKTIASPLIVATLIKFYDSARGYDDFDGFSPRWETHSFLEDEMTDMRNSIFQELNLPSDFKPISKLTVYLLLAQPDHEYWSYSANITDMCYKFLKTLPMYVLPG